jgi:hypothetical protein
MSEVVCPMIPFPNIYWWSCVLPAQKVMVDTEEHFEKMSFRNRYMIASDKGPLTLSVPIKEGRQQRKPMKDVLIDNDSNWQIQHWRSIKSAYNRSPYFQYFEPELQQIFTARYEHLIAFSQDSIQLIMQLLGQKRQLEHVGTYHKEYDANQRDIRSHFRSNQYDSVQASFPKYHQVFEDRMDFLPNLSILDLLFAEAKNAVSFLAIIP